MSEAIKAVEAVLAAVKEAGAKCDDGGSASEQWATNIKWSVFAMLESELEARLERMRRDA